MELELMLQAGHRSGKHKTMVITPLPKVGSYLAIDVEGSTISGPAETREALEKSLAKDALELFSASGEFALGKNTDWGGPVLIAKVVGRVKQVPHVKVEVRMEKIK